MDITIKKLTPDIADDFLRFFEHEAYPEHTEWGAECYCCFFHAKSEQEWKDRTGAQNREIAKQMIEAGTMSGLLAYTGNRPVGWCHYDAKASLPGLNIFYPKVAGGEEGTGAVVCFTVAQGCRGMGIAGGLLAAACGELKARGFKFAEAYPQKECTSDEENYHGPLSMYLKQGFTVYKELDERMIVRKQLI